MHGVNHLTLADFDALVKQSPVPVLLDFWAPWCQPCKQLAPVLDALAIEYGARLRIFKIDVDAETGARERFGVGGIPTMLLMNAGEEVGRHVGVQSRLRMRAFIDTAVSE